LGVTRQRVAKTAERKKGSSGEQTDDQKSQSSRPESPRNGTVTKIRGPQMPEGRSLYETVTGATKARRKSKRTGFEIIKGKALRRNNKFRQ